MMKDYSTGYKMEKGALRLQRKKQLIIVPWLIGWGHHVPDKTRRQLNLCIEYTMLSLKNSNRKEFCI